MLTQALLEIAALYFPLLYFERSGIGRLKLFEL